MKSVSQEGGEGGEGGVGASRGLTGDNESYVSCVERAGVQWI